MPGAGDQDSRDRIRPAVESAGLEWALRRVVVNLSPGTLAKRGEGSTSGGGSTHIGQSGLSGELTANRLGADLKYRPSFRMP